MASKVSSDWEVDLRPDEGEEGKGEHEESEEEVESRDELNSGGPGLDEVQEEDHTVGYS